ncbi:hypothetical protein Esti_004040 [Eimeria stiedai]
MRAERGMGRDGSGGFRGGSPDPFRGPRLVGRSKTVAPRRRRSRRSRRREGESASASCSSESDWTDVSSVSGRWLGSNVSNNTNGGGRGPRRGRRRSTSGQSWRCLPSVSSFGDPSEFSSYSFSGATPSSAVAEALLGSLTAGAEAAAAAAAAAAGADTDRESLWGDVEEDRWGFDLDGLLLDAAAEPDLEIVGAALEADPPPSPSGLITQKTYLRSGSVAAFAAVAAEMVQTINVRDWAFYFALRAELLSLLCQHREAWIACIAAQRMMQHESSSSSRSSSNSSLLYRLADIRALCLLHFARTAEAEEGKFKLWGFLASKRATESSFVCALEAAQGFRLATALDTPCVEAAAAAAAPAAAAAAAKLLDY